MAIEILNRNEKMNTPQTPKMVAVAASAQGYAHKKKNVENQDSFAYQIHEGYYKYQTKEGYYEEQPYQLLVAVVSDGAGSAKYAKSGSSLCVQYLTQHLMQLAVDTIDGKLSSERYLPNIKHIISEHLQYFNQVKDAKQFNHTINIVVYSPTLGGKIIQIGDSPSVVVYSNQADFSLSAIFDEEKKGEYANQTVFSTHKNWEQHLRIEELPPQQPLALFLMTDGPAAYLFEKEKMPLSEVPQYIQTLMNSLGQGTYVPYYQLKAVQKALLNACKYANLHSLKKIADEIGAIDKINPIWLQEFLSKINIQHQKLANGTIENNVAEHIILPVVSVNKMNALIQKLGQATYIDQALLDFLEADEFCESTGDDKTVVAYFPENWLSSAPQYSPNYKQDNIEIDANLPKRDNSVENHRITPDDWPVSANNKAATSSAKDIELNKDTFNKNNPHEQEETPIKPQTPVVDTQPETVEENKKKANNTIKTTQYATNHNDDIEKEEADLSRFFGDMSINGITVKLIILCVVCLLLLLGFMLFKGGKEEDSALYEPAESVEPIALEKETQPNGKLPTEIPADPVNATPQSNGGQEVNNPHSENGGDGASSVKNENQGKEWLKEKLFLAEQGDSNAQYELGMCYFTGEYNCQKDNSKAVEWLEKAANQGHAEAQVALGDWCVEQAQGGNKKQRDKAIQYYTKAANQDNAEAAYKLGELHHKRDKKTACHWYQRAAEQGHEKAQTIYKHEDCDKALSPRPVVQGKKTGNKPKTTPPKNKHPVRTENAQTNPQPQEQVLTPEPNGVDDLGDSIKKINQGSSIHNAGASLRGQGD